MHLHAGLNADPDRWSVWGHWAHCGWGISFCILASVTFTKKRRRRNYILGSGSDLVSFVCNRVGLFDPMFSQNPNPDKLESNGLNDLYGYTKNKDLDGRNDPRHPECNYAWCPYEAHLWLLITQPRSWILEVSWMTPIGWFDSWHNFKWSLPLNWMHIVLFIYQFLRSFYFILFHAFNSMLGFIQNCVKPTNMNDI